MILAMVSALYFALFSNGILKFFNLIFCVVVTAYWMAAACNSRLEPSLGRFVVPDLVDQLLQIPFFNISCAPKILRSTAGKNRKSKNMLAVGVGILVAVPLVLLVGALLTKADVTFARMVQKMTAEFGEHLLIILLRLLPADRVLLLWDAVWKSAKAWSSYPQQRAGGYREREAQKIAGGHDGHYFSVVERCICAFLRCAGGDPVFCLYRRAS